LDAVADVEQVEHGCNPVLARRRLRRYIHEGRRTKRDGADDSAHHKLSGALIEDAEIRLESLLYFRDRAPQSI